EVLVTCDEVCFAVHFDEHANLAAMQIALHGAFLCFTLSALRSFRCTLRAQCINGLFHIAIGLLERLLTLHHPRAGPLAELFYHTCRNYRCHLFFPLIINTRRSAMTALQRVMSAVVCCGKAYDCSVDSIDASPAAPAYAPTSSP